MREYLPIEELIDGCYSMSELEKNCFHVMARSMNEKQLSKFRKLLEDEREAIKRIEAKYSVKAVTINTDLDAHEAHLLEGKRITDSISKN